MSVGTDPNWMTIAGLLYGTAGAFLIGKALLAQSRTLQGERTTIAERSQHRFDTKVGLGTFGIGSILQTFAQFDSGTPGAGTILVFFGLIAALMIYGLTDGLFDEPITAKPAASRDQPRLAASSPLPAATVSETKVPAAAVTIPLPAQPKSIVRPAGH